MLILLLIPVQAAAQFQITPIYTIQGDAEASKLDGRRVDTVGVVTAITNTGFYLQDPVGDGDPQTSDGLFVYTRRRPAVRVNTCVSVAGGLVDEFYEKTELTQVSSSKITLSAQCGPTGVTPVAIPLAQLDTASTQIFEQFEGMVVEVAGLAGVVQGPTKRFATGEAEIAFVTDEVLPYLEGGRIYQWQDANTDALMFLSSALGGDLPDLGFGDYLETAVGLGREGAVLAVLDYNFGKYQILPLPGQAFTGQDNVFPASTGLVATDNDFTICTFNAFALGRGTEQRTTEAEYRGELYKRGLAIAEALQGCTIIGIQETGTPQDAANLAALLNDEFGLPYQAVALAGPNTQSKEFPLTNSLLVRRDRVAVLEASSSQGCSPIDYEVLAMPGDCPAGQFGLFNRPPLLVELMVSGARGDPFRLTVINNHWKSKGGDESINVVRRTNQARHVANLVQERIDADPTVALVVLGDLNDYYASGPVEALRLGVEPALVHTYDFLPPLSRYSYIFNGASQVLDHILVTPKLVPLLSGLTPVHINADYPYPKRLDAASIHHSSDHDPVALRVRPDGASWLAGNVTYPGVSVRVVTRQGATVAETVSDAQGEVRLWGLTQGAYMVEYDAPDQLTPAQASRLVILVPGENHLPNVTLAHKTVTLGAVFAQLTPRASRE